MACPHFHFMNECRHKVCRLWKGVVITMKIPQHVAIILDGNGRWAKSKGMPRNYGHTVGAKNVETVCKAAHDMGIKYLTMYAFSTENWNRPEGEVAALMKLLESYLKNCIKTADKNNMRVRVIGDTTRLSASCPYSVATQTSAQIPDASKISANCLPSVVPEKINIRFIYDILF